MRILAVSQAYLPTMRAGSELSLHYLLRYMQDQGHDVCFHNTVSPRAYSYDGVQVVQQEWDTPDVILAQLDASWARRYADLTSVPLVYWAHTIWDPPYGDLFIANTDHLLARSGRTDGIVLHEPIDPANHVAETVKARTITRVGLSAEKGAHVFWQLARMLPDHKFLGVCGAWGDQVIEQPDPNTVIMGVQDDLRHVWKQTRILIMPSDAHETYGRVGVEAMANGIPVIASPQPGIVEALDIAGIYAEPTNVTRYRDMIRDLDDDAAYEEARMLAEDRSAFLWKRTQVELRHAAKAIEALA